MTRYRDRTPHDTRVHIPTKDIVLEHIKPKRGDIIIVRLPPKAGEDRYLEAQEQLRGLRHVHGITVVIAPATFRFERIEHRDAKGLLETILGAPQPAIAPERIGAREALNNRKAKQALGILKSVLDTLLTSNASANTVKQQRTAITMVSNLLAEKEG